jgi:hypothetical protein
MTIQHKANRALERHADAPAFLPDDATGLLDAAMVENEARRNHVAAVYFKTRAAGADVQDAASNRRRFQINKDRSGPCRAVRPHAMIPSLLCHRSLVAIGAVRFATIAAEPGAPGARCGDPSISRDRPLSGYPTKVKNPLNDSRKRRAFCPAPEIRIVPVMIARAAAFRHRCRGGVVSAQVRL